MLTTGSLFAGMGGFGAGLALAGYNHVWANEIDPHACSTLRKNFPGVHIIQDDIRKISAKDLDPIDVLTAGFPCQSFSQAGGRAGFGDERGGLFFEITRLVREFKDRLPPILFLENVPFLLYGHNGSWFDIIRTELQKAGYWFTERNAMVLNTADVTGIPHRRERLFMIALSRAHFKSNKFELTFPKVRRKSLRSFLDLGKIKDSSYFLPTDNKYYRQLMRIVDPEVPDQLYHYRKYYARKVERGLCPTLTANMGLGGHNVPFVFDSGGLRKLTEFECARLQGFDSRSFEFPSEVPRSKRYVQIGNSVSAPIATSIGTQLSEIMERAKKIA